jgi:hypothetical protein
MRSSVACHAIPGVVDQPSAWPHPCEQVLALIEGLGKLSV